MLQPFGQNVWLRASVPLRYFKGNDQSGFDLASTNNRRTDSFWMSVWKPFGDLKNIEPVGVTMEYPIAKPTLEIRSMQLAKEDPGSDFLEVGAYGLAAQNQEPRATGKGICGGGQEARTA